MLCSEVLNTFGGINYTAKILIFNLKKNCFVYITGKNACLLRIFIVTSTQQLFLLKERFARHQITGDIFRFAETKSVRFEHDSR